MTQCGCQSSLVRLGGHSNARVVLIGSTFPMESVRMGRYTIPFGFQTIIRFRLHCPNKVRPARIFSCERRLHQMYTSLLKSNKSIRTAYAVLALTMTAGIRPAIAEDTPSRLQKSVAVLNKLTDPSGHAIGQEQIASADCVAVIPGFKKGAAVVGVSYGRGFISCRNSENWSAPAAITLEGGSLGVQLGGEKIDIVILSLDKELRSKLLSDRFTIGSDASAAWGNGKSAYADPK